MAVRVGDVQAVFRYPVKSMKGESLDVAELGWHGVDGDRRLALRRLDDLNGFPWLTASKLPELLLFAPQRLDATASGNLPSHVRTPDGRDLALFGEDLAREIGGRHGTPVEMTHLNRGIFDEASVSVITSATIDGIGGLAGVPADVRRFRPNILIDSSGSSPFEADDWIGGVLQFGDEPDAPAVAITNYDERCAMVNFDPDSARPTPEVLRAIVKARGNRAGTYGAVTVRGRIRVGQPVFLTKA